MSSTLLIFAAGCIIFAVTTVSALWVGYLLFQHAWVAQNPQLTTEDDEIRPLFAESYPEQHHRNASTGSAASSAAPSGSSPPPVAAAARRATADA